MIPLSLFLLGCAAVYVGTLEAAFSMLMRLPLRLAAERNGRNGLARCLDDPLLLFVPVRLLLGLVLGLATLLLARVIGTGSPERLGLLILATAAFILVCEHLIPLLIVRRNPERVLDALLPSFQGTARLLRPVTAALIGLLHGVPRAPAAPVAMQGDEEREPSRAPSESSEQESVSQREERRLLQSIMDFGGKLVREVMTPRPDIIAIRADATLDELLALFREQEYSRIPVFRDNLDNIAGVVFVKDVIQLVPGESGAMTAADMMRPAYFVPETKRVPEMLREFQHKQVQLAIVVDEYGGTAGLVTVEDLLEEIVGEIRDEYDVEVESITEEGNGVLVVSGKVDVDEVSERLDVEIEREGFETMGGFLLSHLGRVPAVGETFEIEGLSVQVLEAERRRVNRLRVQRRQAVAAAERD
jgi:putative hemolysin